MADPFDLLAGMAASEERSDEHDALASSEALIEPTSLAPDSGATEAQAIAPEDEHLDEASWIQRFLPCKQRTASGAGLWESLSRQYSRLLSEGLTHPWKCCICSCLNATRLSACEACSACNDSFMNAASSDRASPAHFCHDAEDHVLLVLARAKGLGEMEAVFALYEAMSMERTSPSEAICWYRRAYKLWPELDSDVGIDGLPAKLRGEACALLAALGLAPQAPQTPPHTSTACLMDHVDLINRACAMDPEVQAFMGVPQIETCELFEVDRFPNIIVTTRGTVLAIWGLSSVKVRRSEDGGKSWSQDVVIADGIHGGGATVDESIGDIIVFVEDCHPPAPRRTYRSTDDGKTWLQCHSSIAPDSAGRVPAMHMNEHGITLQFGCHKGRLVRASRWYAGGEDLNEFPQHFVNAVFSDDHGSTWRTSEPFPAMGTGEAAIVELKDGSLCCNSRRHWAPHCQTSLRRWNAHSHDGGSTWTDLQMVSDLPDGPQGDGFGLFGGLARLPARQHDFLVFSNCDSQRDRANGMIWLSLDGGKTWPLKRLLFKGPFAYSSLTVGRLGTPSQGWIYCFFEAGGGAGHIARFNLSWLLQSSCSGS